MTQAIGISFGIRQNHCIHNICRLVQHSLIGGEFDLIVRVAGLRLDLCRSLCRSHFSDSRTKARISVMCSGFFVVRRHFLSAERVPGIIRCLKESLPAVVFGCHFISAEGDCDCEAGVVRDLFRGIELEALAHFHGIDHAADIGAVHVHVVGAVRQGAAGLAHRRGRDCIDNSASLCQFRRVEVCVRDIHQDVLRQLVRDQGVHCKIIDSVLSDVFEACDLLSDQGAEGLIRLKSDLCSSPDVGQMAQTVGSAVLCCQNNCADYIACLDKIGGDLHLIIGMGGICCDGYFRFCPGCTSFDSTEGKSPVLRDRQFLEIVLNVGSKVIIAVVRRLEQGILSVVYSDRRIAAVPSGNRNLHARFVGDDCSASFRQCGEVLGSVDFDGIDHTGNIRAVRIDMVGATRKFGIEGLALSGRGDCVDSRASRLELCRVEVRIGDVHQDILCLDRDIHRVINHCVLFVIANVGNCFSINIIFVVVPADFCPAPDVFDMAESILGLVSIVIYCGQDSAGYGISLGDAVRAAEFDLYIGMTGSDGDVPGHSLYR